MIETRPWGWFEIISASGFFKVKQLAVNPGSRTSLQSHKRRAEHWVVVFGTAKVTIDDNVKLIGANDHVYIPFGSIHRLENPSMSNALVLIEVQQGTYFGEDDIKRYEDDYERT